MRPPLVEEARWRIKDWFSDLDPRSLERLRIYHLELVRWTKKVNLISPSTIEEADLIHFADGIMGARLIFEDYRDLSELWDLGSGNGIPGVVASILRPELTVICVDSDERKVSFLKQLGLRLELDNLIARCQRVESVPSGAISVACARGFAALDKALILSDKQFTREGRFYHFKGPDYDSEAAKLRRVASLAWDTNLVGTYSLPGKSDLRFIIRTDKRG